MVAACLSHDPSKRPSADKLLRHPFFKNCKSPDYLIKNVLQAVPSVEKRFKEQIANIDREGNSGPVVKNRRVRGWNFNEDVLELSPVYPADKEQSKDDHKEEEENGGASGALKETLVLNLVYLLGSLDVQRGMVMNVLAYCGGSEKNEQNLREERERERSSSWGVWGDCSRLWMR